MALVTQAQISSGYKPLSGDVLVANDALEVNADEGYFTTKDSKGRTFYTLNKKEGGSAKVLANSIEEAIKSATAQFGGTYSSGTAFFKTPTEAAEINETKQKYERLPNGMLTENPQTIAAIREGRATPSQVKFQASEKATDDGDQGGNGQSISMVQGGQEITENGQTRFEADPNYQSQDNQITNDQVNQGLLPEVQRENVATAQGASLPAPPVRTGVNALKPGEDEAQRIERLKNLGLFDINKELEFAKEQALFLKSMEQAPKAQTTSNYDYMSGTLGLPPIQQGQMDFSADPISTIKNLTKQVLSSMGVDQANSEMTKIANELEKLENKRDQGIREINDDPWLTEGVRLRRIEKLKEKSSDEINNRINKLQLLQGIQDDARQQAQFALSTAMSLYDTERRFQADQIQSYYDQAQREFDNAIKLQELSAPEKGTSEMQEYLFSVEKQGFTGSFLDYKMAVAAAGRAPSSNNNYYGLTPAQINSNVNSIAGAFDNEPIVKQYNNVLGAYNSIKSIGTNTKNPADDINFIYAFAKIMDPDSVVREGEYATIQKYAQPWAQTFGFNAARIGTNTNFLSKQAKDQMIKTVESRVNAVTNQYSNLRNQYQSQIDNAYTGGQRQLTDYSLGNQLSVPQQTEVDVFDEVVNNQSGGLFSSFISGLSNIFSR